MEEKVGQQPEKAIKSLEDFSETGSENIYRTQEWCQTDKGKK